jgi:hypothetical protein
MAVVDDTTHGAAESRSASLARVAAKRRRNHQRPAEDEQQALERAGRLTAASRRTWVTPPKAVVQATPSLPADIDLFLQRRSADGSWGDDIASGISGELDRRDYDHDTSGPRDVSHRGAQLGRSGWQPGGAEHDVLQLGRGTRHVASVNLLSPRRAPK